MSQRLVGPLTQVPGLSAEVVGLCKEGPAALEVPLLQANPYIVKPGNIAFCRALACPSLCTIDTCCAAPDKACGMHAAASLEGHTHLGEQQATSCPVAPLSPNKSQAVGVSEWHYVSGLLLDLIPIQQAVLHRAGTQLAALDCA